MTYNDLVIRLSMEAPHHFVATCMEDGKPVASNSFELRLDELRIIECLRELEKAAVKAESQVTFHKDFGQELYSKVLAGELGRYFQKQLEASAEGLRISLQFDDNAQELATLPWEFLNDGEDFLVARRNTLISRMPSKLKRVKSKPLESALSMLVVISAPNDPSCDLLDTDKENDKILAAVDRLYVEHKIEEVDFTDDATFETIQSYLNERDYHIVHFTGHGRQSEGQGYLILESEDGRAREVDNQVISDLFAGRGVRLVVLNACQSADLASKLVRKKIPAVVAMQYNIIDDSAVRFASIFYQALACGKAVDLSLTEARIAMRNAECGNNVDFATPVLYLLDPLCLAQGKIKPDGIPLPHTKPVMLEDVQVMMRGFVGRRKELQKLQNAFMTDVKRAAIIYGFGGIGKTVLATHLALRMLGHFEGVFGFKCSTNTRPEDILDEINEFLKMGGLLDLDRVLTEAQSLRVKTASLVMTLNQHPFLFILDNFESCLDDRSAKISDPELRDFVEYLLNSTFTGTKYIFTTRYDFDPLDGRLIGEIEHLPIFGMPFHQAVWLMNNHSELAELDLKKKKDIYKSIGGHPWMIGMFARHSSRDTVDGLMLELKPLKSLLKEFTLFDKSYSLLDDATRELLFRASIFEEGVSLEALSWMMGDKVCASPPIGEPLDALLKWGLVVKQKESKRDIYSMDTLVRDFVREEGKKRGLNEKTIFLRAAEYYENHVAETKNMRDLLKAWNYYYRAENYEKADDIVMMANEPLVRRGYFELAIKLLKKSIISTKGTRKAKAGINLSMIYVALGDLGNASKLLDEAMDTLIMESPEDAAPGISSQAEFFQQQGLYRLAVELYEKSLKIFKDLGDQLKISVTLQQLGVIKQIQGNYKEAVELYQQGLKILEKLDVKGLNDGLKVDNELEKAGLLQQLGIINYDQGNYKEAVEFYNKSLEIFEDWESKLGIGTTLHLLGEIDYDQGKYKEAIDRYHQSLDIFTELKYQLGIGTALRALGEIDRDQGNPNEAVKRFKKSLDIFLNLENKLGIGTTLYSLGAIEHDHGVYEEAIKFYEQSQQIFDDLGNKMGKAKTIYALGAIKHELKDYEGATKLCLQSQRIFKNLGNKLGEARTILELGMIRHDQRDYEGAIKLYMQSQNIFEDLNNKMGTARMFYQLGKLYEDKNEFGMALEQYYKARSIFQDLKSPYSKLSETAIIRITEISG